MQTKQISEENEGREKKEQESEVLVIVVRRGKQQQSPLSQKLTEN